MKHDTGSVIVTTEKKKNVQAEAESVLNRFWTVPNVLCLIRLAGSFILLAVAYAEHSRIFLRLYVFLAMTDWVDGKLAIVLDQRSEFGARLDTWADAALYTALFVGSIMLHGEQLSHELAWILPALGSYILSIGLGLSKFHRWPSYHTRTAKISWLLIMLGAITFLGGWSTWPLRAALVAVTVTNLEATLITLFSSEWRTDVCSLYTVLKEHRGA